MAEGAGADTRALAARFYQDEMNDHLTYAALAARARDPELGRTLTRIAAMEKGHAGFWRQVLERRGARVPEAVVRRPRLALLEFLARWLNPMLLVSLLEMGESGAVRGYYRIWRGGALEPGERERLGRIIVDELDHEVTFRRESERMGVGHVRDFVLGMNDGLVEILGAVAGLTAAYPHAPRVVAVSGLIVGVAGALSMGIGAWISVRSQAQVDAGARERATVLFDVAPERAVDEYRQRLEDSGVPGPVAADVAARIGAEPEALRRLLVSSEGSSAWGAGLFTGGAYLFGVVFPVTPFFLVSEAPGALIGAVLLAGTALAAVGAVIAILSGISLRTKLLEMVGSGFAAAGLAYLFGHLAQQLFGVSI